MSDIEIVLEMLLDKTEAGKISWNTGVRHTELTAVLGRQLVEISRVGDWDYHHRLRVLDSTGSELVSIESQSATSDISATMGNLFDAAQKTRIDSGLAALITELQKV